MHTQSAAPLFCCTRTTAVKALYCSAVSRIRLKNLIFTPISKFLAWNLSGTEYSRGRLTRVHALNVTGSVRSQNRANKAYTHKSVLQVVMIY